MIGLTIATLFAFLVRGPEERAPISLSLARKEFQSGWDLQKDPQRASIHFSRAAHHIEAIARQGYRSAALSLAEGNAWLLAGDLPRAILCYRRGLVMDATDSSLRTCLRYARQRVVYHQPENLGRPPPESILDMLTHILSPNSWFWLTVGFYACGCVIFVYWWRRRARIAVYLGTCSFLCTGLLVAVLVIQARNFEEDTAYPVAVVAQEGLLLRTGNGLAYPVKFDVPLNRGVETRILFARGDWLQIELMTGEVGWAERQALRYIFPKS